MAVYSLIMLMCR